MKYAIAIIFVSLFESMAAQPLVRVGAPVNKAGMFVVPVTNQHEAPLTGLLLRSAANEKGQRRAVVHSYLDAHVNASGDKPIAPGETRDIPVVGAAAGREIAEVTLLGALFADHRQSGDPAGVRTLRGRRSELTNALDRYRERLSGLKGNSVNGLLQAMKAQAGQEDASARARRNEDFAITGVSSLASDWILTNLSDAPQACGVECADRRLEFLLTGLSVWQSKLASGLPSGSRAY